MFKLQAPRIVFHADATFHAGWDWEAWFQVGWIWTSHPTGVLPTGPWAVFSSRHLNLAVRACWEIVLVWASQTKLLALKWQSMKRIRLSNTNFFFWEEKQDGEGSCYWNVLTFPTTVEQSPEPYARMEGMDASWLPAGATPGVSYPVGLISAQLVKILTFLLAGFYPLWV